MEAPGDEIEEDEVVAQSGLEDRRGLVGNWALVEADDGRLRILRSGRNEDVNRALRAREIELAGPTQYVDRWGRFSPNEFFQDVTLSPDLPMVAEVSADLFEKAMEETVDGVVVLDPYAVAAVLRLSGPVPTDELTLNARNVVPFLLEGQYVDFADDEDGRVRALAQLVQGAFTAVTSGELPGPAAVADVLGPVIDQDRLGVWWAAGDPRSELVELAGLDGRFPLPESDMVAVVHQNAGQNKLDTHLRRSIDYALTITDGEAVGTIRVTLHNELEDLTLPTAVVGSNDQGYPLGTNVARLTVHSGLDFRAARIDGRDVVIDREIAFGHDALTALIEVPAGDSVVLEVDVAGRLDDDAYSLLLLHQPLVNDDELTVAVTIDGETQSLPTPATLTQDTLLSPVPG